MSAERTLKEQIEELAELFRRVERPYDYKAEQDGEWCTGPSTIHDKKCFKAGAAEAVRLMLKFALENCQVHIASEKRMVFLSDLESWTSGITDTEGEK